MKMKKSAAQMRMFSETCLSVDTKMEISTIHIHLKKI